MTQDSTAGAKRAHLGARPGGRSERVRAAILTATTQELREVGYGAMTMTSIARRADVALSTVVRRWDSKAALVADTLTGITADAIAVPDNGSLEADLRHYAWTIANTLSDPGNKVLLRSLFALPEAELERVRRQHWTARYRVAVEVMDRAIARGEIPDQPFAARVIELLSATLWMRILVTGIPVDELGMQQLVSDAMAAAKTGSIALRPE